MLTTDEKFYMCPHCKKGFTICSHCDKAGHKESICFEKHPDRRPSKSTTPASSKSKTVAQAHLTHGFTDEQIESQRNFQAMINNPEFKKLNINSEYRM
jgi:DTW domain-containing protein YfiP